MTRATANAAAGPTRLRRSPDPSIPHDLAEGASGKFGADRAVGIVARKSFDRSSWIAKVPPRRSQLGFDPTARGGGGIVADARSHSRLSRVRGEPHFV